MADELLVERHGKVLWLTLNRPETHNALNAALVGQLIEAFGKASADDALRAVVLTGAGERSFCSGADLKESAGGMFRSTDGVNPIAHVMRAIEACDKPVIARINGTVLAGGLGLVAACDLAYAGDHARFALPEVRVGLFPMMVAAKLMTRMAWRRLQEMAYLGESLTAAEAEACGLVNRCVPTAELDSALSAILVSLRKGSPSAVAAGKKAMAAMRDLAGEERLSFAERAIADLAETAEAIEGRTAFAEKRSPAWTT